MALAPLAIASTSEGTTKIREAEEVMVNSSNMVAKVTAVENRPETITRATATLSPRATPRTLAKAVAQPTIAQEVTPVASKRIISITAIQIQATNKKAIAAARSPARIKTKMSHEAKKAATSRRETTRTR